MAFVAILSSYINKILILLSKQDCLANKSDVELSISHNIGSSAEIPCIAPNMGGKKIPAANNKLVE
jgi:hypothetical protein